MAATAVHQLASFSEMSPRCLASDLSVANLTCRESEKLCDESPSTFSQISSETCNSRVESQSANNDFDSWCSVSELKSRKCSQEGKISDVDSDGTKASNGTDFRSERISVARKSRISCYLRGTESGNSNHQQISRDKSDKVPRDKTIGGGRDPGAQLVAPRSDALLQTRRDSFDSSRFSYDNLKPRFQQDINDTHKHDRKQQILLSDLQPPSQKPDCANTKQTCHLKSISGSDRNAADTIPSRTTISSIRHLNNTVNFTASELAQKLRGSMESQFLLNELKSHDSPKLKLMNAASEDVVRSVDDILRDYGITPAINSSRHQNGFQPAYNNISQNNETSEASTNSSSEQNHEPVLARPREVSRQSKTLSSTNMNPPARRESQVNYAACRDTKNIRPSGHPFKMNMSHNNDTLKYGNTHQDLLRKYGSSVDHTSIAAGGKYSVTSSSTNYGRYDYGKSTAFSGDTTPGANTAYTSNALQNIDMGKSSALSRQVEGSQVDILKPSDIVASKLGEFDRLRTTGSSTDAVEFTITSERERLRRLDNMITSTSVTTSDPSAHQSLMTRYLSPQRDYEKLRVSRVINKVYSSPMVPSSQYTTPVTPRSNWAGRISDHGPNISLGKSASVPSYWNTGFQSVTNYSTPVDTRTSYLPYYYNNGREYDSQFNNSAYSSRSLTRLTSQINFSSCSLLSSKYDRTHLNKSKNAILNSTAQNNCNQPRFPCRNASNTSVYSSTKSDVSCKSGPKKSMNVKRGVNRNTNDSKSASSTFGSFDTSKNRNKPCRNNMYHGATVATSGQNQNSMYHGATVATSGQNPRALKHSRCHVSHVKKVETFHNLAKELFRTENLQYSTKAKNSKTGNRKPNGSVGNSDKCQGDRRSPEVRPPKKSRDQIFMQLNHSCHETNKRLLRSIEKNKERIASEILIHKTAALPKSTPKHRSYILDAMVRTTRPHSTLVNYSQSHSQFSTRLPYQTFRDFSTTSFCFPGPSYY